MLDERDARPTNADVYERLIRDDRVSGRLYLDDNIFADEMERIYHRGWVFVGHESEVAEPGEFVTRKLGLQPVIMTRDDEHEVHLFSNRCPHRGALICGLDRGTSSYHRCPYHGWTFDNAGTLVALPAQDGFGEGFDRNAHGMSPIPRMDRYRGFVFGSWSHEGPTLTEHLGAATEMIDRLCDLSPDGKLVVRAGWLKHRIAANWKIMAENVCDFYHPPVTHASSLPPAFFRDTNGAVVRYLGQGHSEMDVRPVVANSAPRPLEDYTGPKRQHLDVLMERDGSEGAVTRLRGGPPHGYIFPNLFIAEQNLFVVQPVASGEMIQAQTPVFWSGVPDEVNRRQLLRFDGAFGPAGMVEPDDSAVWERLQRGLAAGEPEWAILTRGLGRPASEGGDDGADRAGRMLDETAIRGFWHHYRSVMTEGAAE